MIQMEPERIQKLKKKSLGESEEKEEVKVCRTQYWRSYTHTPEICRGSSWGCNRVLSRAHLGTGYTRLVENHSRRNTGGTVLHARAGLG